MTKEEARNTLIAIKNGWVGGYTSEELAELRRIAYGRP